jgi:hypothetical protein
MNALAHQLTLLQTGWIMWLMVLCGLSYGGKVVLYDGSPLTPDPLVTLRMVAQLRFGCSQSYKTHRLTCLGSLCSVPLQDFSLISWLRDQSHVSNC